MLNEGFCKQCQTMLRGESEPSGTDSDGKQLYLHHPDAESLKQALDMQCPLCVRIWTEMGQPTEFTCTIFGMPVRRFETIDGLYMISFSRVPREIDNNLHAVCSFRQANLLLLHSNQLESPPTKGHLSYNTGSESALDFLASKLERCQGSHAQCQLLTSSTGYFPTRAVDVGGPDDGDVFVRDCSDVAKSSPYAALSHCWGGSQPVVLTAKTESKLRCGLPAHALPQTFQDAILVCRKFGIRYLWIDSLCIFQDDLSDWAIEASRMREVYSNAVFTIAATAARDSSWGLFYDRPSARLTPVRVEATWKTSPPSNKDGLSFPSPGAYLIGIMAVVGSDILAAPLSRRAWVIQERYLSPRTMHFSREYLYWECQESFSNELYPTVLPKYESFFDRVDIRSLKTKRSRVTIEEYLMNNFPRQRASLELTMHEREESIYHDWMALRAVYTSCRITCEGDLLVALAGIAREVADMFHESALSTHEHDLPATFCDAFIAGMWRHRFHEESCWSVGQPKPSVPDRSKERRAPTWSWASSNRVIWPSKRVSFNRWVASHEEKLGEIFPTADVIELKVEIRPSGEVIDGYLRLGCRPVSVKLKRNHVGTKFCMETLGDLTEFAWENMRVSMDDSSPKDTNKIDGEVTAIVIYHCHRNDGSWKLAEGILLKPSATQPGSFERIGHFYAWDIDEVVAAQHMLEEHEKAEYKIITII